MKNVLTLVCLFAAASVMAQKVEKSELVTEADLNKYKTFGFFNIDTAGLVNPENYLNNLAILKQAVSAQLISRGYTESSTPDLKINMGLVVIEKVQTRETDFRTDRPRYMGQRNYSWKSEEVVIGYYKEGTLDFHLVDASSNEMVWWATVTDVVPDKQKNVPKTIEKAIKKMFDKFPVKPIKKD
ncbi:MAG: DUF4136 domain-containing protein [Chitinophagaceae bacterium]|nr:DUF4136 domain-containing protein [Chitinophagaceae bacterium]